MLLTPLYHWAPADRHDAIHREGLRPGSEPTVARTHLQYVCLGADPAMAWKISGAMEWVSEIEVWDLWQARICADDELLVRPTYGPLIEEIKVRGPIPPDRLWWVGRRSDTGVAAHLPAS